MHTKLIALSAAAALAAAGSVATATAAAQTTTQPATPAGTTTVTVSPAPALKAGDPSPFDVAGVKAIRRGKPIPAGYALVGKTITTQGSGAGAALRFRCPDGKRLRSFGVRGGAGFLAVDEDYPGKRVTSVISTHADSTGDVYAVCR